MSGLGHAAELALAAARDRGAVDDVLLTALRVEPLLCGVDVVEGSDRPATRQVQGRWCVLAWTSEERARASGWTDRLARSSGADVAQLLLGTGLSLALNPGEDLGVRLDQDGLTTLAGPAVPPGTAVYLGRPDVVPEQLESALRRELADVPGVAAARLVLLAVGAPAAARRLTVVLSLSPGADRELLPAAYAACDRAASGSRLDGLDVVLDEDLRGLREEALAVPTVFPAPDAPA